MKISVCMATYNGGKYIYAQVKSILAQLAENDEIIVVDDCSKDNTIETLQSFNDARIKILVNENNYGHVYSFNKSLSLAKNDIIFMSDQDDIWHSGRVDIMRKYLIENKVMLVTSNSYFINDDSTPIIYNIEGVRSSQSSDYLKNILDIFRGKKNYFGCAMALCQKLNEVILPIPSYVESHDLWIAMAANIMNSNLHMDEKTFYRRVHTNNASILKRPLLKSYIRDGFSSEVSSIFAGDGEK
ncbi:glycosyltransferase [Niabella sp. W65]|nr:glycosyltransferase [Niabella sp. W65]MCH7365045.1 glycosyltransferase [Niabella sp. W65]ULT40858.1 glycosyltransferase [Niabella sp. I65]